LKRLWAPALLLCVATCANEPPSAYDAELAQIQQDIAALKSASGETALALVQQLYHRATLTGRIEDARSADAAIGDAMGRLGPVPELMLLRARLDFAFHRLANANDNLRLASQPAASPRFRAMQADLDLQQGRFEDAQKAYEAVVQVSRAWDNLARLAYMRALYGDFAGADALYAEAEQEVTAKEMRTYAWLCVQRGLLAFRQGRHDGALTHYLRADKAYSGYWLVNEHLAELYGAQRRFDEAVALYEKASARAPRPEVYQALGDLYTFMGKPGRARPWRPIWHRCNAARCTTFIIWRASTPMCAKTAPRPRNGRARISSCADCPPRTTRWRGRSTATAASPKHSLKSTWRWCPG
jgi:tetratricopeptide (TPR) repeat protein